MNKKLINRCHFLTSKEKKYLSAIADSLPYISQLNNCDVFIDVKEQDDSDNAIVIAECLHQKNSLYKESVLGQNANRINEPAVLKTFDTCVANKNFKAKNQENVIIRQACVPIVLNEKTIAVLIKETAVKEIGKVENKYMTQGINYSALSSLLSKIVGFGQEISGFIKEACILYDNDGNVVYFNKNASTIFNKIGLDEDLYSYTLEQLILSNQNVEKLDQVFTTELKIGKYVLSEKIFPVDNEDIKCVVLIEDLTDLKDKDVAISHTKHSMSEMNHRIKNNLQIISSMLRIQGRLSNSIETKKALKSSVQRIVAIANVHELLSKELANEISVRSIISELIIETNQYIKEGEKKITIESDISDIMLDSSRITALAIIINELLINSIEHAFSFVENCQIFVSIVKEDNYIIITIKDNGSGNKAIKTNHGLGSKIIAGYVKDTLKGIIEVTNDNGCQTKIKFKN